MTSETLATIESLLASLLEETDDPEVHYKLRTALQLVAVQRSDIRRLADAASADSELERRLRELGYLD